MQEVPVLRLPGDGKRNMMKYYRLFGFTMMMGMATYFADLMSSKITLPGYTYTGLLFQALVFGFFSRYVSGADKASNPNKWVRRTMVASMGRMILLLTYMLITFVNVGKANVIFAVLYCIYFILFLLFEISEKRTNLRPDSKERSNSR